MEVICKSCGAVNDYRTEKRGNNLCAWCKSCGEFIKNIPWDEPKFWVGKYKGMKISDCTDISYLKWAAKEMNVNQRTKDTILNRINFLENKKPEKPALKRIEVDWRESGLDFEKMGGYEYFEKEVHKQASEVVRMRFLENKIQPEIYYIDRLTHSMAVEFFILFEEDENCITLIYNGGAS